MAGQVPVFIAHLCKHPLRGRCSVSFLVDHLAVDERETRQRSVVPTIRPERRRAVSAVWWGLVCCISCCCTGCGSGKRRAVPAWRLRSICCSRFGLCLCRAVTGLVDLNGEDDEVMAWLVAEALANHRCGLMWAGEVHRGHSQQCVRPPSVLVSTLGGR